MKFRLMVGALITAGCLLSAGCFSIMADTSLSGKGGSASLGDRAFCLVLDAVTLPIQVVVFTPMLIEEYISENTGEGLQRKRKKEEYAKSLENYRMILKETPNAIFMNPDLLCATNRAVMEALNLWLPCEAESMPVNTMRQYAEIVTQSPDLLRKLDGLWENRQLTAADRRKAFDAAVQLYLKDGDGESCRLVGNLIGKSGITDGELAEMLTGEVGANAELKTVVTKEIDRRKSRHEYELRMSEEKRKRDEEKLRLKKERQMAAERASHERRLHHAKMHPYVEALTINDANAFRTALAWYRDGYVEDLWDHMLRTREETIPVENLRLLAETLFKAEAQPPFYIRYLFCRTEFEAEDLRNYYRQLVDRQNKGRNVLQAIAILVCNPKTPNDVVEDSHNEQCLRNEHYNRFKTREEERQLRQKSKQESQK